MRFDRVEDDERLRAVAVLVPVGTRPSELSAFERAVLDALDGARENQDVASTLGIDLADLRIALLSLLQKGLVSAPQVRPRLVTSPRFTIPTTSASSTTMTSSSAAANAPAAEKGRRGEDRVTATALQAQSLRALRRAEVANAWALATEALALAPDVESHAQVLRDWDGHVAHFIGADLASTQRLPAMLAELQRSPKNAALWAATAELQADVDVVAAARAAARAVELAPTAVHKALERKLATRAHLHKRAAAWRSFFGGDPRSSSTPAERRR